MTSRRGFISGLGALFITAPAIVRATSLMGIKPFEEELIAQWIGYSGDFSISAELAAVTRRAFVPSLQIQIFRDNPLLAGLRSA